MAKIITDLYILKKNNENATLEEAEKIIKELEITLKLSKEGVGLAAPQIGINKRVAIIRGKENINLLNPIIINRNFQFINFNEGCLSIPNQRVNTKRYREIFVKDDFHPNGFIAIGDSSIVTNHEIDHLNSILITDYITKIGRNDLCPCGSNIKYKKCHGK